MRGLCVVGDMVILFFGDFKSTPQKNVFKPEKVTICILSFYSATLVITVGWSKSYKTKFVYTEFQPFVTGALLENILC